MTTRKWVRTEINTRTVNPLLLGNAYSNIDRNTALSNLSALTTQVMLSTALPLVKGAVVTNLTFVSATTAAGTPTNWWFGLYDPDGNKIAQSKDMFTTAWAGSTAKTLPLTSWNEVGSGASLKKILTNVATITTAQPHGLAASDVVYVSISDAVFDGQWTVASTPTQYSFTYARTNADVTETAATGTVKKIVDTPHMTTSTGVYRAAIMVKATTVPTLAGISLLNTAVAGAVVTGVKIASQTSGSALTTVAPASIATPTTVVNVPLVIAS
jgi:hypothetical protein